MPPDRLADPVDVLLELPGEAALADPAGPGDRDEAGPTLPAGRADRVLEEPELLVAPDEGRLRQVRATLAAALGDHPQGAPGRHRSLLALEDLLAGRLEGDRAAGGSVGRLADEHGARRGDRLETGGGVHEVAGDHALVGGPDRHRGLAGQDPGSGLDRRAEGPDRVDEVEGGPDRSLGVVLPGDRGAPDGHHRVADELLDRPAVAADDLGREVEVAGQGVPDILGVALLGERGEADQVGEQDRDEPSLGDRGRPGGRGRSAGERRGTAGRARGTCRRGLPARAVPQLRQNLAPGLFGVPQLGQPVASGDPQVSQNRASVSFPDPQFEQITPVVPSPGDGSLEGSRWTEERQSPTGRPQRQVAPYECSPTRSRPAANRPSA